MRLSQGLVRNAACMAGMLALGSALAVPAAEVTRVFLPERYSKGDTGLQPLQPIDAAAWVWSPSVNGDIYRAGRESDRFTPGWSGDVFLRFKNTFTSGAETVRVHVSADNRFVLLLDGKIIARGPDRGTVERWAYQSYDLALEAGAHTLEAAVYWIGPSAPLAQLSWRGGFILRAEGRLDKTLTTGKGAWRVAGVPGMQSVGQAPCGFLGIGSCYEVSGSAWMWRQVPEKNFENAYVVRGPVPGNDYGASVPGWQLYPSTLPDQLERPCAPGGFRAAAATGDDNHFYTEADAKNPACAAWNDLLRKGAAVTVPPNTEISLVWDLDDYYCAYPEMAATGGAGSVIRWGWVESLRGHDGQKHNRGEFIDRCVTVANISDAFKPDGGADRFTTPWWRCGKWCRISVKTAAEPVTITSLRLVETRYPTPVTGTFACDDESLAGVQKICVRGLQMCMHEMGMDCPYYEQQMYPGDTRIQLAAIGMLNNDDRLIRREMELFDFSRREDGRVGMNFPTRGVQDSATYTLIWPLMFGDYVMWHDDLPWVKARLPGLRHTMFGLAVYEDADGLLDKLPGWSFMDWVPAWRTGIAPDGKGLSALNNLFYVYALQSLAKVEDAAGEPALAAFWRAKADACGKKIVEKFWSESRGMLADDVAQKHFSEHAQCLALLTDILPPDKADRAFDGLLNAKDLARATVYFSHYLFDAYAKRGRTDLILKRLDLWRDYVKLGMATPLEAPGHARSDCHAWGSHPLYHLHAAVAGVRPASFGFRTVKVAPNPAGLKWIKSVTPHPKGEIREDLSFSDGHAKGTVTLPEGVTGTFEWKGKTVPLAAGANKVGL